MADIATVIVEVDISKDHLDVAARPGGRFRVANDPAGVADLVARVRGLSPALVVLEATGGYEAAAFAALPAAVVPAAVVNPRRVRQFAAGVGQHPKTDPIDAAVLAHFAAVAGPAPAPPGRRRAGRAGGPLRPPPAAARDEGGRGNRVRPGLPPAVRDGIEAHVAWLAGRVEAIDREVAAAVRAGWPSWTTRWSTGSWN